MPARGNKKPPLCSGFSSPAGGVRASNYMIDLVAANHEGRELELMLAGRKPLAMFCEELSCLPDEEFIPENRFSPYVASGQFIRDEIVVSGPFSQELGRETNIKYVLFAVKDEGWRINAMLLLKKLHAKTIAWNETCELFESTLLGYTDEEIDAWCNKKFR